MFANRLIKLTFLILVFGVTAPVSAQVGLETDLWQWTVDAAHHDSIVKVDLDDGSGTGVIIFVDRDKPVADGFQGWCLTALHVVSEDNGRREIRVQYRNGRSATKCKILAEDEQNDVALLWVWVPDTVPAAMLSASPMLPGQSLEIAGLGGGSGLHSTLRHFSAQAAVTTNASTVFADVTLLPGDSGGPVFNADGQVVGVVSGGWFWWDGGVTNGNGSPVKATWPARTCNLKPVTDLVKEVREKNLRIAAK